MARPRKRVSIEELSEVLLARGVNLSIEELVSALDKRVRTKEDYSARELPDVPDTYSAVSVTMPHAAYLILRDFFAKNNFNFTCRIRLHRKPL